MREIERVMRPGVALAAMGAGLTMMFAGQRAVAEVFATGLVPVSHAVYAKLPSVRRHRGFYKPSVDLSDRFPAPGYQGQQGACVAWATTYAARSFFISTQLGRAPRAATELPSPEYIYSRGHPQTGDCTTGISMVQALAILQNEGVVPLSDYPVDGRNCLHPPPEALRDKAALLKIGGWKAIQRKTPGDWQTPIVLDDVKAQLSQGLPVVFAMPVSPAFMDLKANSGVFHSETNQGSWHAMALVGYDESRQAVRVMNSWGRDWAQGGYAWIDYATFERLAGEAYVLQPPVGDQPAPPPPAPVVDVDAQLDRLLSGAECANLHLTRLDGVRTVQGFGGLAPELAAARGAALQLDASLQWRVSLHPWPQCEAELTLAAAVATAGVRLSVTGADGEALTRDPVALARGEEFAIDVQTAADKPFVHVVYIQADGSAVELYRGAPKPDEAGRRRVVIGADGARGVRFRVDSPFGAESLIAVASADPLFGPELHTQVTEREFLTLLRAKLVGAAKVNHAVSAAIVRMSSSDNGATKTASASNH